MLNRIQVLMHLVMIAMEDTGDIIGTKNLYFSVLTVTKGIALRQVYLYTSAWNVEKNQLSSVPTARSKHTRKVTCKYI